LAKILAGTKQPTKITARFCLAITTKGINDQKPTSVVFNYALCAFGACAIGSPYSADTRRIERRSFVGESVGPAANSSASASVDCGLNAPSATLSLK
jgi:hypothetical protein